MSRKIEGQLGTNRIDKTAREQLAAAYDAHAAMLYRFASMILANPAEAEDAVQQAFVKLAGLGDRITALKSLQAYLRIAVRNECYRILGSRRGYRNPAQEKTEAILEPVDAAITQQDERHAIEAALRTLPPEQREVVHLKVYEGMTFQQIADLSGVSLNTAASRWRYAMDALRGLLAKFQRDGL